MARITPRRRFLITALLALLLPAGLLTYLGLQVVSGIEARYEKQVQSEVQEIVNTVRNQTSIRLKYNIQQSFLEIFENQIQSQLDRSTPLSQFQFKLSKPLPYVSQIFLYRPMQTIYFYSRKHEGSQNPPAYELISWVPSQPPEAPFVDRLRSELDILIYRNDSGELVTRFDEFHTLSYPEDTLSDAKRLIASFASMPLKPNQQSNDMAESNIIVYGFTFDFEYINNEFFPTLLEDLWKMRRELKYPVRITDFKHGRPIATIKPMGMDTFEESLKHRPRTFHNDFPWYWIYFSKQTGQDTMEIANNEKILFYCLIASADIIMVLGLIGALRNIARELEIADMRSDFVARISHELRTPLGLIRLYAETLEMNRTQDESARKDYLRSITKESERLTHLINNILNFSLIEAEKKQYALIETPLDEAVNDALETIYYHIERYGFHLTVDIEEDLPLIECDPEAVQQALYNLLTNAMKYSGDSREVQLRVYRRDGEVVIDVADHGIGIAPVHQKKIFQEFYRVDDPRVRETGGSGLGLALVKHIAEGHDGRLTVKSELGKGSTFSIHLPISHPNLN